MMAKEKQIKPKEARQEDGGGCVFVYSSGKSIRRISGPAAGNGQSKKGWRHFLALFRSMQTVNGCTAAR